LATNTIQRLIKNGNPIAGIAPLIGHEGPPGNEFPFYTIIWPKVIRGRDWRAALLEVDARSGLITHLELWDPGVFDFQLAQQISNRVSTPEPPTPSLWQLQHDPPLHRVQPFPATNDVVAGIKSWLWLCQRLGANPGGQANLESVWWDMSFRCTNRETIPFYTASSVTFSNGQHVYCHDGLAFSWFAPDACFTGFWEHMSPEDRDCFKGKVSLHWEDLAKNLEKVLVEKVGIPKALMVLFQAEEHIHRAEFGTFDVKRTVISWRNWPRNAHRFVSVDETRLAFTAEFDLETGELKSIWFQDEEFVPALRAAESKAN
jgi:hypothetical protein